MFGMFRGCSGLTSLDLSNFNTTNVTDMSYVFYGCSALTTIYVGEGWSTEKVTDSFSMFTNCTTLVGGLGTVYDAEYTDKTYAHIDGGTSNPGYLTLKLAMGDANGDGNINIADAVATVTNILGQPTEAAFYKYAADMNTDQVIDIFDVTLIVNAAFDAASPAPAMTRGSASNIMMEHISMTADADYIYLGIDQPERFTATQFDVTLPEGMELVDARLASATTDHQLTFVKRGDNEYRVIGLSMSNTTFRSINGQLIKLEVSGSAVDSDVKMSNVLFVTPTATVMTSIDKCLNTAKAADDSLYDLKGQRLSNQQLGKGIYIMNHKKVIIK
jgi:surface protein